jgi:lipopolysaccharide/colanic/teichoic acid biosynthesis glycosyltransferase
MTSLPKTPVQDAIKRVMDIVMASVTLILVSPILLLAIVVIRLESPGPIFYVSKRVGRGYRIFDLYKLRTMSIGADAQLDQLAGQNQYNTGSIDGPDDCPRCAEGNGYCSPIFVSDQEVICERRLLGRSKERQAVFFKVENDPRITAAGRFLRRTSIDELPQLINVLKGDLSLVGNRPLPLYEAEQLTMDGAVDRFLAPAGITGLWQVSRRGKQQIDPEERIALDSSYARTRSFFGDLWIIIKTIPSVIQSVNS